MRQRALDIDNDWKFGKGRQDYLTDAEALKLNITTRLKSWTGNCFFAPNEGVDWNNFLDVGTKDSLDRDIKTSILQTIGVIKINSYVSTITERNLNVDCEILSIYGNIFIREVVA